MGERGTTRRLTSSSKLTDEIHAGMLSTFGSGSSEPLNRAAE